MINPSSTDNGQVLIGVMGPTGSGKTTFINLPSGSNLLVGDDLTSCTVEVQVASEFELDSRRVTLIDTPGFDDTNRSDTDVLNTIAAYLEKSYEVGIKLSGLIYIHRISDFRMGGISVRNFNMFRKLCGDDTLKNVIIVTNMWGEVEQKKGEKRETELRNKFFKQALDKGAKMLRHDNTVESTKTIIRQIIRNHPLPLKIQRELVDEKKVIDQTAAGAELGGQLQKLIKEHQDEIRQLQKDFEEALLRRDLEAKRELEKAIQELQAEIAKMTNDMKNMEFKFEDERKKMAEHWQIVMHQEREAWRLERMIGAGSDGQHEDMLIGLVVQMQFDEANVDRKFQTMRKDRVEAEKIEGSSRAMRFASSANARSWREA